MDKFRATISKEMSSVFDKVFKYFEQFLGDLNNKIEKLEKEVQQNNKQLETIENQHKLELENLNSKYSELENKHEELQQDYDNYKKVSLVKSLHEELDKARHEIELLKKKLDRDQITLTIEDTSSEKEVKEDKTLEEHSEKEKGLVEEEEVEEEVEEEEEELDEDEEEVEFIEKKIRNKIYYVTDDDDKEIYEKLKNGEIGDLVGKYSGKRAKFFNK